MSARASARSTRCCRRRFRRRDAAVDHAARPRIARIDRLIDELAARHANLGVTSGRQAIEEAAEPLETHGSRRGTGRRFRVRERTVLRYYARTIEHLLGTTTGRTH